ncbi:MAG: choice-of-anchor B family protein [Gemmatimonadetes bacterium]|nr:choice-of-anchor B family protein [Gemmatimonadota bacterium]
MRSYRLFAPLIVVGATGFQPLFAQTHAAARLGLDAEARIGFGAATAVSGDAIFVGRPGEFPVFPMPGSQAGSVHVYERGPGGWEEVASISSPGGVFGDGFGSAIAADGELLVVGAPKENEERGAAYVFGRDDDGWALLDRSEGPDGGQPGDRYGSAVSISDGVSIIGAPGRGESGSAFVYAEGPNGWTRTELTGAEAVADANFGAAVSIAEGLALVGAPGPFGLAMVGPSPAYQAGAAFVFRRSGDEWGQVAHLASQPGSMGVAVALRDGEALVTAPLADQATGTVLRFAPDGDGEWSLVDRHTPAGATPQTLFGFSLGLAGERVVVGAPGPPPQLTGSAYVLAIGDGGWNDEARLTAETRGLMGFVGGSVAGGDDFAIVGAPASEFFEGIGFVFERAANGEWTEAAAVHEAEFGYAAETGGEQRCGEDGTVAGFACEDVELVSFMPVREVGGDRGIMVSDIWGWTDPDTGREYAILGRFDGTSFIDVTDAENPVFLGDLPLTDGATPNLWRDMKVYANHTFVVADNAGQHGIQVFDLTRLRDVTDAPVEFTEDANYTEFASAHNIVINEESGFAYVVGGSGGGETCGGALHMVDLRDPKNPTFAGCYADPNTGQNGPGYTHDAQCVNYRGPDADYAGKEICFNASESALGIGDVSDKGSPTPISSAAYPNVAYAHQGWLSEDQAYFYLNDELDELSGGTEGTRTLVFDVKDLDDPILVNEFVQDNPASDHNLYVRGQFMYQSNYVSGLRIFDISDPENPKPVGFFDTVPGSPDTPGFAGSWSNYPFFESGNIIVSSMREGLFVLKKRQPELVP